jgi:preprotein translocase SecE subunit
MTLDTKMESLPAKEKKISYFRQVQKELRQVTWTSKEELFLSTKIVLVSVFIFGFSIYLADLLIHMFFSSISHLARLITG